MDLMMYARVIRQRWITVAVVTMLAALLAGVVTIMSSRVYSSSVQFFVSTAGSGDSNTQLAQGSTFSQQRVKSYAQLIETPALLDRVRKDLGLREPTSDLAGRVSATIPPDTVFIEVDVADGSPAGAQAIGRSIARRFPDVVADLERVRTDGESPVKVTVVKQADLPTSPTGPRPVRNIGIGVGLGLLLGLGVAVARQLMDNKLRTKDDVEAASEAIVLGGIPFDADAEANPLIFQADPMAGRAEAFRSLRTNLHFVDAANHPRVIVVTSSIAGEGKSSTTANLALAMAESGSRVCVVEGDLRRPKLLAYLGMQGSVGLTDILIGRYELDDVLQPFGALPLEVLGAGASPPNPSELLGSAAMREVLQHLRARYDYVLIDAAPLLPVTDSAVLTAIADGAVLVAGSGIVTREQFTTAAETLGAVSGRLLGVVLNRVPRESRGNHYDYGYEYRPAEQTTRRTVRKEAKTSRSHRAPSGRRTLVSSRG